MCVNETKKRFGLLIGGSVNVAKYLSRRKQRRSSELNVLCVDYDFPLKMLHISFYLKKDNSSLLQMKHVVTTCYILSVNCLLINAKVVTGFSHAFLAIKIPGIQLFHSGSFFWGNFYTQSHKTRDRKSVV